MWHENIIQLQSMKVWIVDMQERHKDDLGWLILDNMCGMPSYIYVLPSHLVSIDRASHLAHVSTNLMVLR